MVVPKKHRTVVANTQPCGICKVQPFKYICPRCNLRYCSLTCYKDQSHVQCTESFYQSSVMSELQSNPTVMPQDRKKMLGILDRFEKQAIDQEQMMDLPEDQLLEQMQQQQQNQQRSQHPSAGSKTGDAVPTGRRKLTTQERDDLIRKAIEEEQKEEREDDQQDPQIDPKDREEMERMLEQEHQDLIKRFQGVDLDQESFESIWERLSPEEQREFREKFLIPGRMDQDDESQNDMDGVEASIHDIDQEEEELEAKKLLQEMGETLQRGGEKAGEDPMLADLDAEDLRAIRDAEISELIQIWRPWWEIEAENAGQLKKVVVSQVADQDESERLNAASLDSESAGVSGTAVRQSSIDGSSIIPKSQGGAPAASLGTVLERFVLDEEAMLRPHQALVQDLDDINRVKENQRLDGTATAVSPMMRAPHPSLIYHVSALLFAYAATCRVWNGDIKEESEQTLAHIFDLCPFFSPPPPPLSASTPASSSKPRSVSKAAQTTTLSRPSTTASAMAPTVAAAAVTPTATLQIPEVDDFETTLAVLQTSSLDSNLWKGDTLRLEMLLLLLRDLTLILARPSRCLKCIRELKEVFNSAMEPLSQRSTPAVVKRSRLYSKSALHRLFKKLDFYESYLTSEEWMLKTDRLDRVRTEVVVTGIRVRQEMVGWTKDLEGVSRVQENAGAGVTAGSGGDADMSNGSTKRVLIEELP